MTDTETLLLYDGDCRFCTAAVAFVRRHDHAGRIRCEPQGSAEGVRRLRTCTFGCDTLHLFDADGHHERSEAVLRVAAGLGAPWSWFRVLGWVPKAWRDAVYDFVARHRS
jgi:predicted DCC family thiol-disulfide oxidoreductase YuxK